MPRKIPFWWRDPAEKERRAKYMAARRAKNPELPKREFAAWREKNKDYDKERCRDWQKNNPGKTRATIAKRKACLLQRTPAWADMDEIALVYEQCDYIERLTGIPHDVDHIIPLQGKTVSGLHISSNLQILSREENRRKGNRFG